MEWKNEPRSAGREDRVEPAEGYVASAGQTISRDTLLAQALAHVAACTDDVLPPEGFEARLMAAAEKQELFSPATAATANEGASRARARQASHWVQHWAGRRSRTPSRSRSGSARRDSFRRRPVGNPTRGWPPRRTALDPALQCPTVRRGIRNRGMRPSRRLRCERPAPRGRNAALRQ